VEKPVFWNQLGSAAQVANSVIGPNAEYLGGGSFAAGKFGGAFFAGNDDDERVLVPKLGVINPRAGAIDFWGKIEGFPEFIPWGANPYFINDRGTDQTEHWIAGVGFNGNNGTGGGGLTAVVSGNGAATGSFALPWRYDQVLQDDPDGWHHYALVWNADGIPGTGGQNVAVYLDGELNSTQWDVWDPGDLNELIVEEAFLVLLDNRVGQGTTAIDNLKVWDFAKTNFSDRFVEGLTLVGDSGGNCLIGSPVADVLAGRGGNDTLRGLEGADCLKGGDGNDRIDGALGKDVAIGGRGNDLLCGGSGRDLLLAGNGADRLRGGSGDDVLDDGFGYDVLFGDGGADVFRFAFDGRTDRIGDFGPGDAIDLTAWDTQYTELDFDTLPDGAVWIAVDGDALVVRGPDLDVGDLTPDRFLFDGASDWA
jgi:Ca2+-binding RTX toxin-like protein